MSIPKPPQEWGKLNSRQRYSVLALDLFRALALAGLKQYEWLLFEQAVEEGWHGAIKSKRARDEAWPDARPARLNLYGIAKASGVPRERLREARKSLVASRIFLVDPDGEVWINKQADEWIDPKTGKPRLTAQNLKWCEQTRPKTQGNFPFPEPPNGDAPASRVRDAPASRGGDAPASPCTIERGRGDSIQSSEDFLLEANKARELSRERIDDDLDYLHLVAEEDAALAATGGKT